MIKHFVHYDPQTGAIRQCNTAPTIYNVEDYAVAEVETIHGVTARHKVDLTSLVHDDYVATKARVIEYTDAEWRDRNKPTMLEFKSVRDRELAHSDPVMATDRPIADETREAWKAYRQALRDLGQYDTVEQWLANWPENPRSKDPIAHLRERMT